MNWLYNYVLNALKTLFRTVRPAVPDMGTSLLGIAALFFVRAFPPAASLDFDLWLLSSSTVFFLAGLYLRTFN